MNLAQSKSSSIFCREQIYPEGAAVPFDNRADFCQAVFMIHLNKKFVAMLLAIWLPLFSGNALAASVAHGLGVADAVREAQEYTWQTLQAGFRPGMGQYIPDRLFWAREEESADD